MIAIRTCYVKIMTVLKFLSNIFNTIKLIGVLMNAKIQSLRGWHMSTELSVMESQSDAIQVGETLRLRRQMRGMSLKQVAEPAGISVGMLSQVERGLAAPSIKTLRAICSAMDMPVNWLFHRDNNLENQANEFIVQSNSRRSLTYNDGALIKELLTPDTQPQIQMLRFLMEPGADSGEPYSNADGGKCGLVLRGTLGLELDERQFVINTGDSFAFPARSMVRFWTVGETTCEVIWVVSPATV
ncbi:helix-turn-helix domain-containing protein [Brucella tritici]|nr:XRE family transcriptional regulator [Brucella tritici]